MQLHSRVRSSHSGHAFKPRSRPLRSVSRHGLTSLAAAAALLAAGLPASAVEYSWGSGAISSSGLPSSITINDTLAIGCFSGNCGSKILDQSFLNNGTVYATDHLYFQFSSQVFTNGWQYQLQGDVGLINSYADGMFINEASGSLVKTSGTGISTISISSQSRGGSILDAMSGTIAFTGGTAVFDSGAILLANAGTTIAFTGGSVSFADGVKFLSTGRFNIGTNASFGGAVGASDLAFTNGTYTGGDGSPGSRATLTSDATWSGNGTFAGAWTLNAGKTLTVLNDGTKYVLGSMVNLGTLDTASTLYFQYSEQQIDNQATLKLNGDVGLATAYSSGTLINTGTLSKTSGTGVSGISSINVINNGGTIDARMGVLQFNGGTLNFNNGTRFTGPGSVEVLSGAQFVGSISSENLVLKGGTYTGGDGGANPLATLHGNTRWTGGSLAGQWELASDHALQIDDTSAAYIQGTVTNKGSINTAANLYFQYSSQVLDNQGTLDLQGDVGMVTTYASGTFLNSGTLLKTSGVGTSSFQGMQVTVLGSGIVDVRTGSLVFSNSNTSLASGAQFKAAAGSEIQFTGGTTSFASGVSLQGDGQYTVGGSVSVLGSIGATHLAFSSGTFTGGDGGANPQATLTSDATWSGNGSFMGAWTVSAGKTLTVLNDGGKYVLGSVINLGTLDTASNLYFQYSDHQIDNRGTLKLNGDVGLATTYASGTLINTGTLTKSAGAGISAISGINITNNGGTIDARMGVIQFSGATLNFNGGTQFTGPGSVEVLSSAQFSGSISSANLLLKGATYTGGDGGLNPTATLHGSTRWAGGTLAGQWELAADHTLNIESGSAGYINGVVTNLGTIHSKADLYFQYSSQVLDNRGMLDLQSNVGMATTYASGTLLNSGTLVKSGGTGESNLASIVVTNTGTMDVQTGTLRLPNNFINAGTLKGVGTFAATGLLTNDGTIAPGASPGTLTLASNLLLTATSTLELELESMGSHDLLQVQGDITLGGTLALSCYGACTFAAGSDVLVLDATGLLTGSFSAITVAGLDPNAFDVRLDAANGDVWLHALQDVSAVPEPSPYALLLAGLGVFGFVAKRRSSRVGG